MTSGGFRKSTLRKQKIPVSAPILQRNLYGLFELRMLLGVSESRMRVLASRSDFPAPWEILECGRVWKPADVLDWAENMGRIVIVP